MADTEQRLGDVPSALLNALRDERRIVGQRSAAHSVAHGAVPALVPLPVALGNDAKNTPSRKGSTSSACAQHKRRMRIGRKPSTVRKRGSRRCSTNECATQTGSRVSACRHDIHIEDRQEVASGADSLLASDMVVKTNTVQH